MINIGILGGADIAYRMFCPAIIESEIFGCLGIASKSFSKREKFSRQFKIETFSNYKEIILNDNINAVYIPLPPALHYKWAKIALQHNKHVMLEKPFTPNVKHTRELIEMARKKGLALHENYMFEYHKQLEIITSMIAENCIGEMRVIRVNFSIPKREADDFRYSQKLGGGALLDVGGYTMKLARILLGDTMKIKSAMSKKDNQLGVDVVGGFSAVNENGVIFQGAYGLDTFYQCNLEILGSLGKIVTNRVFTAPPTFKPIINIETIEGKRDVEVAEDNHFINSIKIFESAIFNIEKREKLYMEIGNQATNLDKLTRLNAK